MLSVRQLSKSIDSLSKMEQFFSNKFVREISPALNFVKWLDSGYVSPKIQPDSGLTKFEKLLPDSARSIVSDRAITQINYVKNSLEIHVNELGGKRKELRFFKIEWHRKFALSVACLVLFLIGAPLGSIIRKGGLGTPLVFAIVFFVIFHLLNTFGEKFVKEGVLPAIGGMWLSSIVLLPIGLFLTWKAMRDSNIMSKEFYTRLKRSLWGWWKRRRSKVEREGSEGV
jgi:lipopolysaccharide export system permease protein